MKLNKQEPEKRDMQSDVEVHSIFSTIQGEGPFCGHPAIFVRLAGCNLQCPGCDTDYTSTRNRMQPDEILRLVNSRKIETGSNAKLVVITGGEPFRQNLEPVIRCLIRVGGFHVQVETNGTMKIPDYFMPFSEQDLRKLPIEAIDMRGEINEMLTIVCSPKAAKLHPSVYQRADCFKYVMKADNVLEEDGLPLQALDHQATPYIARPRKGAVVYLQPMDEQDAVLNQNNIDEVVARCMKHGYIVQLQVHKYLNVE